MGTRADFYIAKADELQWKGSIAFDGYSIAEADENDLSPNDKQKRTQEFLECEIKKCTDEKAFEDLLTEYLNGRDDATFPKDGWPWPWNNSKLTDETYLLKDGRVWRMYKHDGEYEDNTTPCYFAPIEVETCDDEGEEIEPTEKIVLCVPDMKEKKNVAGGNRSGMIVIGVK